MVPPAAPLRRRQAAGAVACMALTTAAVALVVGAPAPDPGIPAGGVVVLGDLVPVAALLASAVCVRGAARLRPATALRAE